MSKDYNHEGVVYRFIPQHSKRGDHSDVYIYQLEPDGHVRIDTIWWVCSEGRDLVLGLPSQVSDEARKLLTSSASG